MKKRFIAAAILVIFFALGFTAVSSHAEKKEIPHINAEAFALLMERAEKPVLIQFDASWCPYCKGLQPALQKLAAKRPGLVVFRIDTDAERGLMFEYEVTSLPTLVIFQQGKEVARHANAIKEKQLFEWVDGVVGK